METTVEKNHVRAVARAGPVLRALAGMTLAILACAVLPGCNKGIDPKPLPKYLLYATLVGRPPKPIAIIDCKTDSIVNYVTHTSGNPEVVASPDGKYFAVASSGVPPEIFDAVTLLPIKLLATSGFSPVFVPDAGILVHPSRDSTLVYSVPDFTVRAMWHRYLEQPARVPGRRQVAVIEYDFRTGSSAKLLFYDYVSNQAVDSLIMEPRLQTIGFHILSFTFSPNGERLYALGWLDRQNVFIGYDLGTRQTLFLQPVYTSLGSCRVTPDGREVWVTVTDPGYEDFPDWPQGVFIFDALTGTLVDTVSTRDISPIPYLPIAARDIRFLPDGSKAYVSSGSIFKGSQPILVINPATRRVERLIFDDFKELIWTIDIAPRL